MYKMVEWNETLDLEEFYREAERRGLEQQKSHD